MLSFNSIIHLFGRYPIIARNREFADWLSAKGCKLWYEEAKDGIVRVYVVSYDETSLHVVELDQSAVTVTNFDDPDANKLVRNAAFDISGFPTLGEAVKDLQRQGHLLSSIVSARFTLGAKDKLDLRLELVDETDIYSFSAAAPDKRKQERGYQASDITRDVTIMNDWLSANDLHSPALFQSEAQQWTAGPTTVREKARNIAFKVSQTYRYDATIPLIAEFTWRDTLTRDRNGRRGICDEYAVVEISYLRSLLIPARIKFMVWTQGGQGVGHACLEFLDQGRWTHMDGLWNAFDNPGIYRASGAVGLTVMDADEPNDARSSAPAWGKPDIGGDGLLHPYKDFILNPGYPGNSRPGYSN